MYKLENDKLYYFDDDIIVCKNSRNYNLDCVIDDDGYKLLSSITVDTLSIDGGCLLVNGRTKIGILNKTMPKLNMPNQFKTIIKIDDLRKALKFIAVNKNSPVLTGVFINNHGTVAATDRFKFYCDYQSSDDGVVLSNEFVKALCENGDDTVLIKYEFDSVAGIFNNGVVVFGRLIQGKFPRIFELLEPKGNVYSYDSEKLKKSLNIGSLVKSNYVEFKNGEIIFEGEINTYVDETDIPINVKLSLESLKSVLDFNEFYFQGDTKPLLFVDGDIRVVIVGVK